MLLGIIVPVVTLVYLVQLMRRQNRKLEDGERFRSNFFAHMNHELRTPLNSIIGFSDVMANERYGRIGNERYAGYVKDIHFSGMHLLSLINDVLDMSKIEAGQLTVEDEVFPLSDLMHETVTLLAQQADAKAITVGIEYEADAAYLRADPQLCKQVFLNLLDNAIKFSHVGGAITVGFGTADHGGAVVTIADTGVGIAEADIDRVVEPFIQSRHDVTVAHHGTGLGLTLCDNIMKLHGGTLKMESELNKGTLVTVSFPPDRTIMPMQKRAIAAV